MTHKYMQYWEPHPVNRIIVVLSHSDEVAFSVGQQIMAIISLSSRKVLTLATELSSRLNFPRL